MNATLLKARSAGLVGLASISMLALAACGGGGEVSTDGGDEASESTSAEATTEAATTEAATTEAPATEAAGIQPATDADIEPAKQVVADFYDKAANADFAGACGLVLDPGTSVGLTAESTFMSACMQGMEGQKDTFAAAKGVITADLVGATVDPDGRLAISIGGSDSSLKAAKGSDGKIYIDLLGSMG